MATGVYAPLLCKWSHGLYKGYDQALTHTDPHLWGEEQKKPDTWKWARDLTQSAKCFQDHRQFECSVLIPMDVGVPRPGASPHLPLPTAFRQPSLSQTQPHGQACSFIKTPLSPGGGLSLGGESGLEEEGLWAWESRI